MGGTAAFQRCRGTAKVRPERALIEAPAEHREGWIAMIRSRHWGRPECANTGHSAMAYRTGQVDPLLPFKVGRMNEREKAVFGKAWIAAVVLERQGAIHSIRFGSEARRIWADLGWHLC